MKDVQNLLHIKNRKKFLNELTLAKKQNLTSNLEFVKQYAEWLKHTKNKEWSKRQKLLIDEVYKGH